MAAKSLLVELFVEELPPKALRKLGESFAGALFEELKAQGLTTTESIVNAFASPRRLAAHITAVHEQAAHRPVSQKLMPVSVGLDAAGNATSALLNRLKKEGLDTSHVGGLVKKADGQAEYLYREYLETGVMLRSGLHRALAEALARLPIPKVMSYQLADGWSTVNFVRPSHGLVALHGADVVPVSVLGLTAGRDTQGHRFEAVRHPVSLRDADSYETQMETEGAVVPSFEKRRNEIARQLAEVAVSVGGGVKPIADEALLDEVTALVERPNVLLCRFEPEFLQVPQECLILTMKANQKYFPLLDANGRLTNQFLIVSNIRPADPGAVIGGNERVVRPRLADAKFFFDQDRKKPLVSRVELLDKVVYHNKLGSQGARTARVRAIARDIAHELRDLSLMGEADKAAELAKADLLTDMVGEFPELQGVMGRYYALHDGLSADIADAIEDHYKPRFAGDGLPRNRVGILVALADKLETLVGIFGIGLTPTGDKDPFGLRRAALGVLRMLMEKDLPLDLMQLLERARSHFAAEQLASSVAVDVFQFMLERLRVYLKDQGYAADEVEAVVVQQPTRIDRVPARLDAVREFRRLPEAEALAAANKRIRNILRKAGETGEITDSVDVALLTEPAEKALYHATLTVSPIVEVCMGNLDYTGALKVLAGHKNPVDRFFDEVMVNTDEPLIRANRLALLNGLARTMNCVADISRLAR